MIGKKLFMKMFDNKCVLVLFAGPNGSGKTTVTKRISKHKLLPALYLNPDDIASEINPFDSWGARIAAGRKAVELRNAYLEDRKSFVMETTLSGVSEISFIKEALSKGYSVTAIYVAIKDTLDNITRVKTRVKQGGHGIPHEDIARRRERSLKNLSFLIDNLPRVIVIDNTSKMRPILRKNDNKITYVSSDLPVWFTSSISNEKINKYRLEASSRFNCKSSSTEYTYFTIPFYDKDKAKCLGAKWDRKIKHWYVPAGTDLKPFIEKGWKRLSNEELAMATKECDEIGELKKSLNLDLASPRDSNQGLSINKRKKSRGR